MAQNANITMQFVLILGNVFFCFWSSHTIFRHVLLAVGKTPKRKSDYVIQPDVLSQTNSAEADNLNFSFDCYYQFQESFYCHQAYPCIQMRCPFKQLHARRTFPLPLLVMFQKLEMQRERGFAKVWMYVATEMMGRCSSSSDPDQHFVWFVLCHQVQSGSPFTKACVSFSKWSWHAKSKWDALKSTQAAMPRNLWMCVLTKMLPVLWYHLNCIGPREM